MKRSIFRKTSLDTSNSDESEVEFLYEQDFYKLREECLKNNVLFEDPEFPPDNDLLRSRSGRHLDDLEWLRPHEFLRPPDGR